MLKPDIHVVREFPIKNLPHTDDDVALSSALQGHKLKVGKSLPI